MGEKYNETQCTYTSKQKKDNRSENRKCIKGGREKQGAKQHHM